MIPGVAVYHPRSEWESAGEAMATSFTRQPPALVIGDVSQMVYHYTAASNLPDGDAGESIGQIPQRLRNSQHDYLANRNVPPGYTQKPQFGGVTFPGYPLGYSFMVDWLGGVWELRGFDYRPAATNEHNSYTVAVLFYTDGASPGTDAQWASARAIGRECRRRANRPDFVDVFRSHGELRRLTGKGTITTCAGVGLEQQALTLGLLDYDTPTPAPPPGDDDMALRLFVFEPPRPDRPLFASADGLTAVHVKSDQWPLLDQTRPIELLEKSAARQYTFVGEPPAGCRGIWANA